MGDILSQEELDALLSQMQEDGDDESQEASGEVDASAASSEAVDPPPAAVAAQPPASSQGALQPSSDVNVDMVLNLPMKAQVEIGRAKLAVGEILRLCQGSVIELDHMASDLIDLTVNDKVVAQGEAVVVNESFGFRVLEVESIGDRIKKL